MRLFDSLVAVMTVLGLVGLGVFVFLRMPQIESGVEARLQAQAAQVLATNGADWASVSVDGQVARISGTAPSETAAGDAADRLLRAAGAGGPVWGGITHVETDIDVAVPISPYVITAVRTDDDRFVLEGHLPSAEARARMLEAAGKLAPGNVVDRLQIGHGAPDGQFTDIALQAVGHLQRLETGRAELSDTRLTVSGVAMDEGARAEISAAVANLEDPWFGEPELRGPGHWFARHRPEGLLLKGRVNSEADRARLLEIARENYDGQVLDEMQVASDGPEGWSDGVRLGLPHFSGFRSGRMTFAPGEGGLRFEGEATGSTLAFLAEDMAGYTGPFAVEIVADKADVEVAEISGIDFKADPRAACQGAFASVLDGNSVNFASGKAEITRDSGATLDKLMAVSARCSPGLLFEIGGHTDSAGERAFNTYLSDQRARAVVDYMISRGFPGDRLAAVGYGPADPVADNRTAQGRAENRRIEFTVLERSE
jgi:OmpA-OmpF porin, OOP family